MLADFFQGLLCAAAELHPFPELTGFHAAFYLPGGVLEGYVVGVELGADGELADGLEVYERDPGEVDGRRTPVTRHTTERLTQFVYRRKIPLTPQLDLYASVSGVLYFYTVQDRPFSKN